MSSSSSLHSLYSRLVSEDVRTAIYHSRQRWKRNAAQSLRDFSRWHLIFNDKNLFQMHARLEKFRGRYVGQRCIIMGNGPSLNKMNLELMKNEMVWGSNRCYLLFDRISWRPKFYVAVDGRVVVDNASEINLLPDQMPETNFFFPVDFRYKKVIKSAENLYWYKEVPLRSDNLPFSAFSANASKFVRSVKTVTVAMLQLAVFMGFHPIYLIGCDTSYTIPNTVKHENDNPVLLISTTDDPNHFDSSYFGVGKKWHDPGVESMVFHYEQSKRVCDLLGVQIYNATVGGNLEVFPRVDYEELF